MENVIKWKVEDWCDHASYEAMIQAVGAKEIDPYVRKHARCGPAKDVRIDHYFSDRGRRLSELRKHLIGSAGRNGRLFPKL